MCQWHHKASRFNEKNDLISGKLWLHWLPLKKTNFPSLFSYTASILGGRPFQKRLICMGYPGTTELSRTLQNHWSCEDSVPQMGVPERREDSLSCLTLKTKSSCRRMARVLKPPSQMLGLALGSYGLAPCGGRGGLVWRSCFRGSEGGWKHGGGAVGGGLVGCGALSGGPTKAETCQQPFYEVFLGFGDCFHL